MINQIDCISVVAEKKSSNENIKIYDILGRLNHKIDKVAIIIKKD